MKANRPLSLGLVIVLGVVALALAVSSGSAKKTRSSIPGGSAVSVKQTSLGQTLADANGRTLYLFQGDKPNISNVSNAGLAVWPPFTTTGRPQAKAGANPAQISTIAGIGGSTQVTYDGHPLYYYVGDQQPGSTRGQGLNQFGALWYVLSPNGSAVTRVPSTPAPAAAAPSGGGYGY